MVIVSKELLKNVNTIKISGEKIVECFSNWKISNCVYYRNPETNKITTLTIMIEPNNAQLELD